MSHPKTLQGCVRRAGLGRWMFFGLMGSSLLTSSVSTRATAQERERTRERDRSGLHEPVYRVSTATKGVEGDSIGKLPPAEAGHPLDEALEMARDSLAHIESHVRDYTCTLVKREFVHGELQEHEFMTCKIRHEHESEGRQVPFSVYLNFHKPDTMRGREVIYVEGHNSGKIVAHEGGFKGRLIPTVNLMPTSALALRGNRYPITEIGIATLTRRLIEKGERDRRAGDCEVRMVQGAKVKGRVCTMLEVRHPDHQPYYDFHLARVFLDNELNVPIRYEAYDWPSAPGGAPSLIEEYTYMDLKLNVGLEDADFDSENPRYRF